MIELLISLSADDPNFLLPGGRRGSFWIVGSYEELLRRRQHQDLSKPAIYVIWVEYRASKEDDWDQLFETELEDFTVAKDLFCRWLAVAEDLYKRRTVTPGPPAL